MISVVVPVYGCEKCLHDLYSRLLNALRIIKQDYEIILVNDSSPDSAWTIIKQIASGDPKVIGLNLSRNFGQHYAITAGIANSKGDWVIVMDCDTQDRPEEIPNLFEKAKQGFDIVLAKRSNRQDKFLKKLFSKLFYSLLSYVTSTRQDHSVANFGIYHRKVINAILEMKDSIRYFPTMVSWVGFQSTTIEVVHAERSEGRTSYSFKKLAKLAIDIVLSFSDKPLRLTVKFGLLISFLSLLCAIYYVYKYFNGEIIVLGWASLVISIWFLSGVIILVLGVIGLYLGKTFENVKGRPMYIIKEKTNE
jgi:glycosyltransferase involved in cell wall biosynthesis